MKLTKSTIGFLTLTLAASSVFAVELDEGLASSFCEDKWTKRGELDQRMFNYCMKKQREGTGKVNQILRERGKGGSKDPLPNINEALSFAMEKWSKPSKYQMNMVAYELDKQVEGYLDVQYGVSQGKYSQADLNRCSAKWNPQWNMVAYCLDN